MTGIMNTPEYLNAVLSERYAGMANASNAREVKQRLRRIRRIRRARVRAASAPRWA